MIKSKTGYGNLYMAGFLGSALSLVILFSSTAMAQESKRSLFFSQTNIGAGWFYRTNFKDTQLTLSRFSLAFENKMGANFAGHFSVFLFSSVVVHEFETVDKFANWVFKDDDFVLLKAMFLMWFIPLAAFLDSHLVVGPGVAYHLSQGPPSVYFEAGGGFSSMQSVADDSYLFGFALFSGAGVEITDSIGFGARLIWTPASFHSQWTPSDSELLSLYLTINL